MTNFKLSTETNNFIVLDKNPQYLTKKQSVFQKIAAFIEKFKGVGGKI